MDARVKGMVNGNSVAEGWERENGMRIRTIVERCWERSWKRTEGFGNGEDNGWDCDRVPSEYRSDIDKRGIEFGSGRGGGKSGMLGDNMDGWKEEEPGSVHRSTRILLVGEHALHRTLKGRRRPRC